MAGRQLISHLTYFMSSVVAQPTRKLCYRKDVRVMHNPTIRTWFEARKSICTI